LIIDQTQNNIILNKFKKSWKIIQLDLIQV